MPKKHQQIAILDFGSQYTHLISRRIRDFDVQSKIYPQNVKADVLKNKNLIGVILSGGPQSVYDKTALEYDPAVFDLNVPILGLCYGHQLIAHHFRGKVKPGKTREYGFAKLSIKYQVSSIKYNLFDKLQHKLTVWMSHGDTVTKVPSGFKIIASTDDCAVAAMGDNQRQIYGLQFHPEVHHTKDEDKILYNFIVQICKAKQDWKIDDLLAEIITDIKSQASGKKIFMLVSGGVDSSVAFALLEKALGKKNVIGLHIDGGIMRQGESNQVKKDLAKAGFDDLNVTNAENEFLKRLINISDPEQKRKIIGEAYLDVAEEWFEKNIQKFDTNWLLGQGTIYPDTIESGGTKQADTIKTHHNRIDRIQKMIQSGRVIEPLKNFYKDEVREIGHLLNVPDHLLNRHPFPGPGLGVMALCSQKNIDVPKLKIPKNSLILPIKSTGVQGDNRTYAFPLAVWEINDYNELEKFSTDITNRFKEINRVVKVCWIRQTDQVTQLFLHNPNLYLTKNRLDLLRKIHHQVNKIIQSAELYNNIWEFPIILLPIGITPKGQSIVLRPISSKEAMTVNFFRLPPAVLNDIINSIKQFPQIEAVLYDVTNKPPATIQWE